MKIKKHIVIVLSFLILVSNVGLAFNVHYCAGKLSGVSFAYRTDDSCTGKKTETEKKCCAQEDSDSACCKNNKIKIEKTTSENVLVKTFQLDLVTLNNVSFWQPTSLFAFEEIVTKSENPSFYCDTHAPPLYQLYSQYIFYA